jgi:flagellar protein FliL
VARALLNQPERLLSEDVSMAESTTADATESPAAPARKKPKLIVMIAAAVLVLASAGGGVYWFTNQQDAESAEPEDAKDAKKGAKKAAKLVKPTGPAIYVAFDPPFVVNFEAQGITRFLQITAQVMTRDPETAELIKQHDPVIRNDLLLLFGNQPYETISTREGKEKLRGEALRAIAKVIAAEGGKGPYVEQLYFTSFVMQ